MNIQATDQVQRSSWMRRIFPGGPPFSNQGEGTVSRKESSGRRTLARGECHVSPGHERHMCALTCFIRLMLQTFSPSLPFKSLVIVEPMVSPGGDDLLQPLRTRLVRASERRRDSWSSLDEARGSLPGRVRSMKKGDGKRPWDDRVVEAFLVRYVPFPLNFG